MGVFEQINKRPMLHLNLHWKWFKMIYDGVKKEEYRELKTYWNRIFTHYIKIKGKFYHPKDVVICFSNGYKKDRPQIFFYCAGLYRGQGKLEWGAKTGKQYHIIRIGDRLNNG